MLNKVEIIGNLGRDPESRHSQAGNLVASLSVATSERWTDKETGEIKESTEWHRVGIVAPKLAEIACEYLKKGSKVYIEGQLRTRKWTDKDGIERYSTEIIVGNFKGRLIMLDKKEGSGAAPPPAGEAVDDEIPF